ncbi:MAG: efflux transporter outer membrane subunit [Thermoanaerobaculia bacterium]
MSPSRRLLAALLPALALAGCASLVPHYQRPELALPPSYSAPAAAAVLADGWWRAFGDPALDRLVEEALGANQDLAAAAARVEEARALLGLTRADRYPELSAGASASRSRFSADNPQIPPGINLETDTFRAVAQLSYQVDFWGRFKAASAAARAALLATEAGRANVRLEVAAEVVTAYLDRAGYRQQLEVARQTLGSREESLRLERVRFESGTLSELDVAQAEAELAATEATVPGLERALRQTEVRLAVLLGRVGGSLEPGHDLGELALPEVPVGLPSSLLARRPDVVAAEQELVAANARVAQARAAYFPLISLTAYAGSESSELSNLLGSGTFVWQAAASLVQPIFNAGRTRRNVEAARARELGALAAYKKAAESAFAEVESALVALSTSAAERAARGRQSAALERARDLARLRYDAGDSSYLELLDAERNLFAAQLSLARARRDELAAAVTLFQALGGGWGAEGTAAP